MLPKQIEEAADLAEEMYKELVPEAPDEPAEPEEGPDEEQPPEEDELEELRKFKDRYLHLKGKYDAEVTEFADLKKMLFEKVNTLEKPVPKEEPPVNPVLEKFKETYGEEVLDALRELIKIESEPLIKGQIEPVDKHINSVEEMQMQVAQENFINYLDTKVQGDWNPINQVFQELRQGLPPSNTKIADFLLQEEPSGLYTYGQLVSMYNEAWDADKLAKVFNTCLESLGKMKSKTNNPARDSLIAPSRDTQHVTPKTEDKRIWTQDTIAEFQKNDRMNKYTAEESTAMWNDLLAAMNEGRIR